MNLKQQEAARLIDFVIILVVVKDIGNRDATLKQASVQEGISRTRTDPFM